MASGSPFSGGRKAPGRRWPRAGLLLSLPLGLLSIPVVAEAQVHPSAGTDPAEVMAGVGLNMLAGGLTAGVTAAIRRGDVREAFVMGAVGGGIAFAGKGVAAARFQGSGFLARQLGAVGSSVVANAGSDRDWFEEVWIAAGPVWFQLRSEAPRRIRIDARDIVTATWLLVRAESRLDWERSLSHGTLFFTSPGYRIRTRGAMANGVAMSGLILVGENPHGIDAVGGHEMIHVIQSDFMLHTWSRPLEGWAWGRITDGAPPVDLGVLPGALLRIGAFWDLLEREAQALDRLPR